MWHLRDYERWINPVGLPELRRRRVIKGKQHDTHEKKQSELKQNRDSAGKQGRDRLPLVSGRQQPLNYQLVGTVAGRSQEGAPDQPRPKCVRFPEVRSKVEHAQLMRAFRRSMNRGPSAGDKV